MKQWRKTVLPYKSCHVSYISKHVIRNECSNIELASRTTCDQCVSPKYFFILKLEVLTDVKWLVHIEIR